MKTDNRKAVKLTEEDYKKMNDEALLATSDGFSPEMRKVLDKVKDIEAILKEIEELGVIIKPKLYGEWIYAKGFDITTRGY